MYGCHFYMDNKYPPVGRFTQLLHNIYYCLNSTGQSFGGQGFQYLSRGQVASVNRSMFVLSVQRLDVACFVADHAQ